MSSTSPTPAKISKYQPIWDALKKDNICRITAPPQHHKTIVKMVKNKRDDDAGYKYLLEEAGKKHRITYSIQGTVITFKLHERIGINGL